MDAIKAAPAEAQTDTVYVFEALGFVRDRAVLKQLEQKELPSADQMWQEVREVLEPLGLRGINEVYLTEDDAQGARDIQVFVVVRIKGDPGLREQLEQMPAALERALEQLASHVCTSYWGRDRVSPEGWQLADW